VDSESLDGRLAREMSVSDSVPAAFRGRFVGLEELRVRSGGRDVFDRCFGCGPTHPAGLKVRCFRTAEGVLSPVMIARQYEGPPGATHGGIVAAYLDEILAGAVVRATGRVAITGELTIRYVRPVPPETPLLGRAHLVADHRRNADAEGQLEDLESGQVLATARGRFFFV